MLSKKNGNQISGNLNDFLNSQINVMIKTWCIAIRPKTLPAAAAPVVVGMALAYRDSHFHPVILIATLAAAILIQMGTNLANDVYDFLKGSDTENRLGPVRVTQSGMMTPDQVKKGMSAIFIVAIFFGLYLAWIGGWPIVWIGLASIITGIAYTGGPYPLGYHGWGDAFVFIFFGLIAVSGTYYLQTNTVSPDTFLAGAVMGMISTAILVVNNLRDVNEDIQSKKRTLAVRFGKRFVMTEYLILLTFAYIIPVWMALRWNNHLPLFLTLFSLPIAVQLSISVWTSKGKELNNVLSGTSRFLILYSLLFSLGIIL